MMRKTLGVTLLLGALVAMATSPVAAARFPGKARPAATEAAVQRSAAAREDDPPQPQVSEINNDMTLSKTTITPGDTVKFQTKTKYAQMGGINTNPYTSNYLVSVNWKQFQRPAITRSVGIPDGSFSYVSSDSYLDGEAAWQYYSGCCKWFYVTETWELEFDAVVDSYYRNTRLKNYHGQWHNFWDSAGPGVWVVTDKK